MLQTERIKWNCQNKGTSWKNLQADSRGGIQAWSWLQTQKRALHRSSFNPCVSTRGEAAPGLHQCPQGAAASQPLPSAVATADPTAACWHSKVTHKARRLPQERVRIASMRTKKWFHNWCRKETGCYIRHISRECGNACASLAGHQPL